MLYTSINDQKGSFLNCANIQWFPKIIKNNIMKRGNSLRFIYSEDINKMEQEGLNTRTFFKHH